MKKNIFIICVVLCSGITAFGQQTATETARQEREKYDQQIRTDELEGRMKSEADAQQKSFADWSAKKEAEALWRKRGDSKPISNEERQAIRATLEPNSEDKTKYKPFLEHSNTGLFRLMPNFGCNSKNIVVADDRCAKSYYIGEYYSFRTKDYAIITDWFDITFKDGNLVSRGFLSQGILTTLGNVPLENISINDPAIKFLTDYQPAKSIEKVKDQFREINAGIKYGDYQYSKSVKAMPETTYALRVIAYHTIRYPHGRNEPKTKEEARPFLLNYDKSIDLTVAFRVVRVDDDGSLIILWKYMDEKKSPELKFLKSEKSDDINK